MSGSTETRVVHIVCDESGPRLAFSSRDAAVAWLERNAERCDEMDFRRRALVAEHCKQQASWMAENRNGRDVAGWHESDVAKRQREEAAALRSEFADVNTGEPWVVEMEVKDG